MSIKTYYGSKGKYLKEHNDYFSGERLIKDVKFIKKALKLKKQDKILDLACGHGRHTIELKKQGFNIEGLDFSKHLISLARKQAKKENLDFAFYVQDIHKIKLNKKYDKIFLFFSEFGLFDPNKALLNIFRILKSKGLFLIDLDNIFRLARYLDKNPKSDYIFDFETMELKEKKSQNLKVRYYTVPEIKMLFEKFKLDILNIYGSYDFKKLNMNSQRIIVIGQKR